MDDLSFKNRLQLYSNNFSKSDEKIAEFVSENLNFSSTANIIELSKKIGISNSTFTRFCQKLHYRNFGEFQALLLSKNHNKAKFFETIDKIADYYQSIIRSSIELANEKALSLFISKIQAADRILACGLGSSGLTAKEFSIRLSRMGKKANAITDSHMMLAQVSLFNENDVLIAISNSGMTMEVINACRIAKSQGVLVCLLTQYHNEELSEIADIILFSSSVNQVDDTLFINSQLPLIFLMDAVTYGLLKYKENQDNYNKTLRVLSLDKKGNKL